MQYKCPDGNIVDAVVFFNDKIIPIDAKFSLEKYNKMMEEKDKHQRDLLEKEFKQDIKNRIDETSKYINPRYNTTDFAFMFIPPSLAAFSGVIWASFFPSFCARRRLPFERCASSSCTARRMSCRLAW